MTTMFGSAVAMAMAMAMANSTMEVDCFAFAGDVHVMGTLPPGDHPASLPAPLTPLIGRDHEVTAVRGLLGREDVRLVTLIGPGGVGKTRLAGRVAAELADDCPDGVWFVPLAAVRDPDHVAGAIAQTLEVREAGFRSPLECITSFIARKTCLIVLDNVEHLLASASLVAALLARCPRLLCLVTSRALLRITGEHAFPVLPLSLPPSADKTSVEQAQASPAVRLFVMRAHAVRPDFALTTANAGDVAAICRRLDGLPLAIELAAARARSLRSDELATRLVGEASGSVFQLLTRGARDAPDRQQTLHYTIAWSHDLLSPREQALFRRLSVFFGGFTLEAAESVANSVAGTSLNVVDGIAALIDQSLLQHEAGLHGESRYSMLETVREFAQEQLLASGEEATVQRAHGAYFLALAERAAPELHGDQQQIWLERLQVEHANLSAVLARSEQSGDVNSALRLTAALWRFWHRRGYWQEGRGWLVRFLSLAETSDETDPTIRAMALTGAGWLAHYLRELDHDDFAAARAALEEGRERYRRLGRTDRLIEVIEGQSWIAQSLGESSRTAELCEEALTLSRSLGDRARIAESLCNLSRATRELGEYTRARALAQEALTLDEAAGHRGGAALALLVLGDVARDCGDTAEVRVRCEECLAIFRAQGEPIGEGFALHNLAVAAYGEGILSRARTLCEESLAIFRRLDVRGATAEVLASLAPILDAGGEPEAALAALTEALQLALEVGPPKAVAASLEGFAFIAAGQEQQLAAVELAAAAAALRAQIGVPTPLNWQARFAPAMTGARETLGEEAFRAAWDAGQVTPLAEMVAVATRVNVVSPARGGRTRDGLESEQPASLSPRELDVLRLLVDGKTDREIAAALFISRRTVSNHVGAILTKLAVASRTEAAILAAQRGYV